MSRAVLFASAWLALPLGRARAASLANPASANCEAKGGAVEIYGGPKGGQSGYCRLADQAAIEEWTLLRGARTQAVQALRRRRTPRGKAPAYCSRAGGKVVALRRGRSSLSVCVFPDRSSIDVDTLFQGLSRRPVLAAALGR
ncbi:MAG: DUF333 domain-containing protein [Elusimicrobia bacterium]|nr:DUF333 domain-containing protein [Elusimicrobiota bacterium]